MIREERLELDGFRTRALTVASDADRERPPIVLLHGWSDSADTWRRLLALLDRRGHRAVALDMPGFGEASRLDRSEAVLPQLDRFVAAAARRESERAGGSGVVLAGNSLGGCVAMRAAEDASLPLAGIVPIAPAGLEHARWFAIIEGERLVRLLARAPLPLPEVVVRDAVGRVYRTLAFRDPRAVDATAVAAFTRHVRSRRDVIRVLATGRRLRAELADPFRLERIACPVLLVWGDSDRMVLPAGAERVLRVVSHARLEVIERCGHCPQIEAPARLAGMLEEFAAALGATGRVGAG